jgi:signal transduction histidine kinase
MFLKSLSGRFLLLTIIGVMLAEVMIFVPSVARFRLDYLQARLERGQIASLALLAAPDQMIDPVLEAELLENAGILNVALKRDEVRELMLASPMETEILRNFDLRDAGPFTLIVDAYDSLINGEGRVIRVIGEPVKQAGLLIDVALYEDPLRDAMIEYGKNIFYLSLIISVTTAVLLFIAVRLLLVRPISRLVHQIKSYEEEPEDRTRIIKPQARVNELFDAEVALQSMETQLSQSLRQKERLAALGSAVSKISHDLRNMLTTAQLLADRMEMSDDPRVQKSAPKLVGSLSRAVNLCERTLTFGKAEEPAPVLGTFEVLPLLNDVAVGERLAIDDAPVKIIVSAPNQLQVKADQEQLFRVVSNLVRNARQVLVARKKPGEIIVEAYEAPESWIIEVADTGPGLPQKALDKLFKPFEGGVRSGGSGLGLAISSELVKGHQGKLELVENSAEGAVFRITLPRVD